MPAWGLQEDHTHLQTSLELHIEEVALEGAEEASEGEEEEEDSEVAEEEEATDHTRPN